MKFHFKSFLLGAITGALAGRSFKKHGCSAKFPTLKLPIPSENWPERGSHINLVFHFYSKDVGHNAPWQLICYEQEKYPSAEPDMLLYPKKGTVLHTYKDGIEKVSGEVYLSNNIINTGIMYDFIHCTKQKLDSDHKILIFTPCDTCELGWPDHLIYKVHIKELDPLTGTIKGSLDIDPDCFPSGTLPPWLYHDEDGDHIKSNPCPPFTVQLDVDVQK